MAAVRGGVSPEEARQRAEERNRLLKDALDVLRGAGAKLEPMTLPEFPANAIGFILSAEAAAAFDDLTRSKGVDELTEQGPGAWPNTFRVVAVHSRRSSTSGRSGRARCSIDRWTR